MAVLIANNAKSTLAAPIGALDTTLTVDSGSAGLFPIPTGGDYFYVTLENTAGTVREIVKVTARAGAVFTIVRAQDDTLANIFAAGSVVELRINKASLTDSIGAAAASATAAASSASAAASSAAAASSSASSASTSAGTATTQAGIATTQAGNAATSATAANNSAIAAAASAASGMYSAVQDKSANYTVVAGDAGDLLRITTTSGPITITLPVISTVGDGFKIAVVKWTADGNPVNINRSGSDTINGGITSQIGSQFSQVVLIADLETSQWVASQSGLGATNVNVDVFSGNNSTVAFTLSADPSTKNNTYVSISGVYQAKSTYSVSGTTLTFSTAPPSGTSNIEVVYGTPLAIGTPSDGTVSTVKLADSAVTTAKIVDGAVTTAKLSTDLQAATYGMKNRIINGAMMIDQRNAGASVTPTHLQFSTDRWQAGLTAASKFSFQQNSGSVTLPAGFINYLGVVSLSAYSVGSSDTFLVQQNIEGLNTVDLAWGTASASAVTLSFWVRSSLTGTFGGSLTNSGSTRSYPFSYTISSANTWEQKSITIAGETTGTWLSTSGTGIGVRFGLGSGSTLTSTAGASATGNYIQPTGSVSVVGTSGATFYITGVQLEKGSTATSYDFRSYGTELALCQRYAYVMNTNTRYVAGNGYFDSTTSVKGVNVTFPVTMRAAPTITYGGTTSNFTIQRPTTSAASASAVGSTNIKTDSFGATATAASASTAGFATVLNLFSDATITASAEL